jgi:hypothetical protein
MKSKSIYLIIGIIVIFSVFSLGASISPTQPIPLVGCSDISSPGYYYLGTNHAIDPDDGYCIDIYSSNVILDGRGHKIYCHKGEDQDFCDYAIATYSINGKINNVTIFNLTIENLSESDGLDMSNTNNLVIHDVTIINTTDAIWGVYNSSNVKIYNNTIIKGSTYNDYSTAIDLVNNNGLIAENISIYNNRIEDYDVAFFLDGYLSKTYIYNNYIKTTGREDLVWDTTLSPNSTVHFNIPKTPGKNIINGNYIGGNYWALSNGRGFSQTCSDNNRDGLCDSCLPLGLWSYDMAPLTNHGPGPVRASCNIKQI